MRVTNSMLMRDMMYNLNHNMGRMAKYHAQMQRGGQRILRPSDDPVGLSRVLKYNSDINVLRQFKGTIKTADSNLKASESTINGIKEMLQRIRFLTVGAADGSKTPDDLKHIAIEVAQLREEIISAGNATDAAKYLFSGLETDKKLFNKDGTFNIDMTTQRVSKREVLNYEVAVGEVMDTGVHPINLFGMVEENNPLRGIMPFGGAKVANPTKSELSMKVDATKDFTSSTIQITVDGQAFRVDTTKLKSDFLNPMNKERLVTAFETAEGPGGVKLASVADVFYGTDGKLVVRNKEAGAAHTIQYAITSAHISNIAHTQQGIDFPSESYNAVASGGVNLDDAAIAAATGKHAFVIKYADEKGDAKVHRIELDFDALNSANDLVTAMQTELNAKLGAGTVRVGGTAGNPLTLTVTKGAVEVDTVVANKSKMISDLDDLLAALNTGDHDKVNKNLTILDQNIDRTLSVMGEIGGKTNRLEFINHRVEENVLTFTEVMDKIKFADMAELITMFKDMENIYRASLSVGAKVVQPSLVDFIR